MAKKAAKTAVTKTAKTSDRDKPFIYQQDKTSLTKRDVAKSRSAKKRSAGHDYKQGEYVILKGEEWRVAAVIVELELIRTGATTRVPADQRTPAKRKAK